MIKTYMSCNPWDLDCNLTLCSSDLDHWADHNCQLTYEQSMSAGDLTFGYSEATLAKTQLYVGNLFDTFLANNTFTDTNPNPFQETIRNLCLDPSLPGGCDLALQKECAKHSRSTIESSDILSSLCGCYTPPNQEIIQYTLGTVPCLTGSPNCISCIQGQSGCVSLPACDPLCRGSNTVQKADRQTGNFIGCPQTICAMDSISVSDPNVTFNQTCSGCGGGGCICVISGVNVPEIASNVGLGLNFNQYCGENSICITNGLAGPCPIPNPQEIPLPEFSSFPSWGIVAIVGISLLILGLALFL